MKKFFISRVVFQLLVTILLTVVIIIAAVWSFGEARKELVSSYSRYTLAMAKNNADQLDEKFGDLERLFDYVIDAIERGGIKSDVLASNYFEDVYSSIAEDFLIFTTEGDIIYRGERLFLESEQLKKIFLEALDEEKGLPTPRLSEYKKIKFKDETLGVFLYFKRYLFGNGNGKSKVYLTFVISGERIANTYIKSLNLGNEGYAYIIDDDHFVIASGIKSQTGKDIYQIEKESLEELLLDNKDASEAKKKKITAVFNKHKQEKIDIFNKMIGGEVGTEQYTDHTGKYPLELISFYPIVIPGDTWSFAIKTPYTYVTDTLRNSFIRTLILTTIFIIIIIMSFIYIIYNYKKRVTAEFEVEHVKALLEKEHDLRKAEYKYKQLYLGTKDIILICNSDYVIEEINGSGVAFVGENIK